MEADAAALLLELTGPGGAFVPLHTWGATTLGMVTGANKYFAVSPAEAARRGFAKDELVPVSPPGSRHLRGLSYTAAEGVRLGDMGAATLLFRPAGEPSAAARRYIAAGERDGVHTAYKCRVRTPWWRVPLVRPADLLLTCMNADSPRLVTNDAGARHLNSVHGVYLETDIRATGRDLLPLASLSTVSLLSAEISGRSYGGGVLKLEPGEAAVWSVASPALLDKARDDLRKARTQVVELLARHDVSGAARLIDDVLLVDILGVDRAAVAMLAAAREKLLRRRQARGRAVLR